MGAASALLLAPQSGGESREWVSKKARKGLEKCARVSNEVAANVASAIDAGKQHAADVLDAGQEAYRKAVAKY